MADNPKKGGGKKSNARHLGENVKTARGRKLSSTLWLHRQLNDPYVKQAKLDGYRSRAAYKLLELDERFRLLKPGMAVVDLGAAPGGWTQVAVQKTQPDKHIKAQVVGLDLLPIDGIPHSTLLQMDFTDEAAPAALRALLLRPADIVLSDMAPNTTGHGVTDHIRIMNLCELAFMFACEVLAENGVFVTKVFQGGAQSELLTQVKQRFRVVKHAKPKASRADSSEMYLVATGFRRAP